MTDSPMNHFKIHEIVGLEKDGSMILTIKNLETGEWTNWKAIRISKLMSEIGK